MLTPMVVRGMRALPEIAGRKVFVADLLRPLSKGGFSITALGAPSGKIIDKEVGCQLICRRFEPYRVKRGHKRPAIVEIRKKSLSRSIPTLTVDSRALMSILP